MENTILSVEQEVLTFVADLHDTIPDDCLWIAAKRNNSPKEFSLISDPEDYFDNVYYYASSWGKILYSSMGIHCNGERKIPHIHWVFCIQPKRSYANKSTDRINWLKEQNESLTWFKDNQWTFQYTDGCHSGKPKWCPLAYPLKEGNYNKAHYPGDSYQGWYFYNQYLQNTSRRMSDTFLQFLISQGTRIYQETLAKNEIRDLSEQKKQDAVQSIADCAKTHRDKFSTYKQMVDTLEIYYMDKLELKDKPCLNNYRTACQKVGNSLGIFRYADYV